MHLPPGPPPEGNSALVLTDIAAPAGVVELPVGGTFRLEIPNYFQQQSDLSDRLQEVVEVFDPAADPGFNPLGAAANFGWRSSRWPEPKP